MFFNHVFGKCYMRVMKTSKRTLITPVLILLIAGCTTLESSSTEPASSKPPKHFRTIELNGTKYSEEEYGPFEIWECRDTFDDDNKVLFEIGHMVNFPRSGFILYDGSFSGDSAFYKREGLNKRWDWETTEGNFSFIIKPDGTGLYYDFSHVPDGEKIKANDVFQCSKK